MRANTVMPRFFTSASNRFIVSSGPLLLLIVINPAVIAVAPNLSVKRSIEKPDRAVTFSSISN
jgi:hypothetical protein